MAKSAEKKIEPTVVGKIELVEKEVEKTFSPTLTKKEINTIVMSLRHTRDFHSKQIQKLEHSIFSDIEKIKDKEMAGEYQAELTKHRQDRDAAISAYKKMRAELERVYGKTDE